MGQKEEIPSPKILSQSRALIKEMAEQFDLEQKLVYSNDLKRIHV